MSVLRDFEKRLEGAVEGFFARAFRSGLQPVELAKAIQRYASNYQQVGLEGVFVPNVYRFALSHEDLERFSGFNESLRRELAEVVTRTASDRAWRLQGAARVELVAADHVRVGTYELRGKVEAPRAAQAQAQSRPPSQPAGAAATPGAPAQTQVAGPGDAAAALVDTSGRRHPVRGVTVVGRLPECDVTLDDPAVSRRHARITASDGTYTVEDLGSTNGVRINGEAATRGALRDGDELDLGGVRVTFSVAR